MFPLLERNIPHIEEKILSYLEPKDLAASRLVSRKWSCKVKPFLFDWFGRQHRNRGRVPLIVATTKGYVDLVAYFLRDEHLNVNEHYVREWTALLWAAHLGLVEIVKLLLQREDINVNASELTGKTPLIEAAFMGHASIAEYLLQHPDIKINEQTAFSKLTALDYAYDANAYDTNINEGKRLIVSMLEKRGATRNVTDWGNFAD